MERSSQRGERPLDQVGKVIFDIVFKSHHTVHKNFANWQDVDSAFNFLETYSTKAEEEPEEGAGDGSYSSYLAEQTPTGIPRCSKLSNIKANVFAIMLIHF